MTEKEPRRGRGRVASLRASAPPCAVVSASVESAGSATNASGSDVASPASIGASGAGASGPVVSGPVVSGIGRGAFAAEMRAADPFPGFEPRRAQRGVPELLAGEAGLASALPQGAAVPQEGPQLPSAMSCGASVAPRLESVASPVPRALVVDDDPEVRRALARFLRPELDVCLAGSVSGARAIVASLDRLDVAFVDWDLPDGTGEQILEWLARWPDAIRVLISARFASTGKDGSVESPLHNRALANLVLGKPVATSAIEALKRAALALPHD